MEVKLYIDGQEADVIINSPMSFEMQANDLFSFDKRENSYLANVYLPTTAKNQLIFNFADEITGDNAGAYKRYSVDFYLNGVALVKNAIGTIAGKSYGLTGIGTAYDFEIKENSTDIYTFLVNKDIKSLPLDKLDFQLTAEKIKAQHEGTEHTSVLLPVALYGREHFKENGTYDFDVCVPAIQMDWILKQIEKQSGLELKGKFFETDFWKSLYMSVSKGEERTYEPVFSKIVDIFTFSGPAELNPEFYESYLILKEIGGKEIATTAINETPFFSAPETGTYNVTMQGIGFGDIFIYRKEKGENVQIQKIYSFNDYGLIDYGKEKNININASYTFQKGEGIYIKMVAQGDEIDRDGEIRYVGFSSYIRDFSLNITLQKNTNIQNLTSDFSLQDWFLEVLKLFALTTIRDKEKNVQHFYTLNEMLQAPILDWSNKLIRVKKQKYHAIGSYAIHNKFMYKKYDEQKNEQSENDYVMIFQDETLAQRKDFTHKFFGALNGKTLINDSSFATFVFWEGEAKEKKVDGQMQTVIEYKEKDSRFHLLQAKKRNIPLPFEIENRTENNKGNYTLSSYYYADFDELKLSSLQEK